MKSLVTKFFESTFDKEAERGLDLLVHAINMYMPNPDGKEAYWEVGEDFQYVGKEYWLTIPLLVDHPEITAESTLASLFKHNFKDEEDSEYWSHIARAFKVIGYDPKDGTYMLNVTRSIHMALKDYPDYINYDVPFRYIK